MLVGVAFVFAPLPRTELEAGMSAEAIVVNPSGLRRSARLRKLKENKGKVLSQYFSDPVQRSALIRQVSKKPGKRQRDQSGYEN